MDKNIINFYKHYLARNETYEKFENDVNTLGGALGMWEGWIDTKNGKVIVKDRDFNVKYTIPLKKVWETKNQKKLI